MQACGAVSLLTLGNETPSGIPHLLAGHKCPILGLLSGSEFVRRLKRLGRERGVRVRLAPKRGKGSHATLYYGDARTVIQELKRELPAGTYHAMLAQLGLSSTDLE